MRQIPSSGSICMCVGWVGGEGSVWLNAVAHLLMTVGVMCCKRGHSPGAQLAMCWVSCQLQAGRGKQSIREYACSCHTAWQSNTGSCNAGRSRLGSLVPRLHLGGFSGRRTEGMSFQRMSPPHCVPARGSSPRPAAAATASRGGLQVKGLLLTWRAMQRYNQSGEGSSWPGVTLVPVGYGCRGGDCERTRKGQLLPSWIWKHQQGNEGEV